MKSFLQHISEASNLAPAQLYKYDSRVELFIDKYTKGEPFTLVNGESVKLAYDPEAVERIRLRGEPGKIKFMSTDGGIYYLKDFAKTKEFGGGGGSGAGADITELGESAQCYYAAAAWQHSKLYSAEDLTAAARLTDTTATVEKIINDLPLNWVKSSVLGAERLYKEFGNKGYIFHRGSTWVKNLEAAFKRLNKTERAFSNVNKWTPADIWLISAAGRNIDFRSANSIAELNSLLTAALRSRDIIGVSCKLLKGSVKLSYENFDSVKKIIEYKGAITGKRGFFSSKDVYLFFTVDGQIQFRTFPETFQGEIKGKLANHGKLSYGPIQSILRSLSLESLPDIRILRSKIKNRDAAFLKEYYTLYTKYKTESTLLTFDQAVETTYTNGEAWLFSKYLGIKLLDIISQARRETDFVNACVSYASSTSELSAPFVKIQ